MSSTMARMVRIAAVQTDPMKERALWKRSIHPR
jgi:hypothetical protein